VEAIDLIQLGRRLAKLGEHALRGSEGIPNGRGEIPIGATLVAQDVLTHEGSTVSEITVRTGLPQSYVSESVARLREEHILVTETDPDDRRRTRVSVSRAHLKVVRERGKAPVEALVCQAMGDVDTAEAERLVSALETLAERLRPVEPGAVVRQLRGAD
jgi:DNA-binding MarR family transcriptional regulator